ncbi:MAG: aminotransferase class I/II-fold pyridoxal phosphate-dependent enzyme [Saprospiraceae bacterium]|nr:aminotransferase class I/II-fold pyridoxal phosphate-dependent enzyme [Saprospiraceae bacterium]
MENFLYAKELSSIKKSNRFRTRDLFDENLIDLASNDYLGLSTNKYIFQKAYEKVLNENYHSPKASMLVNGYNKIHKTFEDKLCEVNKFEAAITVGSGFLANISLIEALVRKNDTIFIDEEYHASGILATKLLKPEQVIVFNHNDFLDLKEKILNNKRNGRILIAIEGVYSMGGDLAPIEIFQVADEYQSYFNSR